MSHLFSNPASYGGATQSGSGAASWALLPDSTSGVDNRSPLALDSLGTSAAPRSAEAPSLLPVGPLVAPTTPQPGTVSTAPVSLDDLANIVVQADTTQAAVTSIAPLRADFDGDGQVDLLWRNYTTGANTLWLMNGTTVRQRVDLMAVPDPAWRIQGVADFDQDGKSDILWQNATTGDVVLWYMNGTTRCSDAWIPFRPDGNWQIQGTGDLNGDRQPDILWRNEATGANTVWLMNGTSFRSVDLPTLAGANLRMQGTGDFNGDGQPDILWRNFLTGENTVWWMNGTTQVGTQTLTAQPDVNWQIQTIDDVNRDGKADLIWRQVNTGENVLWLMNGTIVSSRVGLPSEANLQSQMKLETPLVPSTVVVSGLAFSGLEGDAGSVQIQLRQAPTAPVTLTLTAGSWLTVDADGTTPGTQSTLTFTAQNWNQPRTVWFIAEDDDSSSDRTANNTIAYSLSGGLVGSGVYNLGTITNTYAPDPTRFNIDLDFRNDAEGFWTLARRAVAQRAANDWAAAIANEWTGFALNNTLQLLDSPGTRRYTFDSHRYVDDLVLFVNNYTNPSAAGEPSLGGPDYEFGGWITTPNQLMPRVGQIAISSAALAGQSDLILYQVVLHEIGHTLGLLGLDWIGYSLEDRSSAQTAVFTGAYSRAANGGNNIPLQSQNGGDYAHPGNAVRSIMSYGWIYNPQITGPTAIDYAMLADSGYRVYGVNA